MKEVKSKNYGVVFLLEKGEVPVEGKICFTAEELEWARDLGKERADPESEKAFWAGVLEAKKRDYRVSVFDLFPKEIRSLAEKYCRETIEMLRAKGARTRMEKIKDEEEAG